MSDTLIESAILRLGSCRALVLGDLVLDAYLYGDTGRVSREAPVVVVEKRSVEYRLGGAANTAANLSTLGVATTVLSATGDDVSADALETRLVGAGVDVDLRRNGALTTPVKTRVMAGAHGTGKQQVLRIDETPRLPFPRTVQIGLADRLRQLATAADIVVVSDYGLGTVSESVIAALVELAKVGTLVCVDSRHQLPKFVGVTAVTPNVPEAEEATGIELHGDAAIDRAGTALRSSLDCRAVLLTLGRGGMRLFREDRPPEHVDIVGPNQVTDVTGAGDTVIATFSAAIASGLGMSNAMKLANVAAGIVVNKMGTSTATPAEICDAAIEGKMELEPWAEW